MYLYDFILNIQLNFICLVDLAQLQMKNIFKYLLERYMFNYYKNIFDKQIIKFLIQEDWRLLFDKSSEFLNQPFLIATMIEIRKDL